MSYSTRRKERLTSVITEPRLLTFKKCIELPTVAANQLSSRHLDRIISETTLRFIGKNIKRVFTSRETL